MPSRAMPPPRPVKEEWKESTAPVDVRVVLTANNDEAPTPKRCSFPSRAAPAIWFAEPGCAVSTQVISVTKPIQIRPIAERIA